MSARLFRQIVKVRTPGPKGEAMRGKLLRTIQFRGTVVGRRRERPAAPPPAPEIEPARPFAELRAYVLDEKYPPKGKDKDHPERGSPKGTIDKITQALDELEAVGVHTTADIDADAIERWADAHRDRTYNTNHSVLRSIRRVCNLARKAKKPLLTTDPFAELPLAEVLQNHRRTPPVDRHLSASQVRALLDLADAEAESGQWQARRLRALAYLLTFTGVRRNEALGMRVADVDLHSRIIYIRPNAERGLKTAGSEAPLGINPELARVLAEWLPETGSEFLFPGIKRAKPWRNGGPGVRALDQLKALGERAGVPDVTFVAFRQTVATLAERWGWKETAIQRQLRHTSTRTQQHYRRADLDTVRTLADQMDYGPPGPRLAAL